MLTRRNNIDEKYHEIAESDGYKFAVYKTLASYFDNFTIYYMPEKYKGIRIKYS